MADEGEWQVRPDLAKLSKARREKERLDLKIKNMELRDRLHKIKPAIIVTSREGSQTYEADGWLTPITLDQFRSRDKYPGQYIRTPADPPAPSWLGKWEKYTYAGEQV